MEVIVAGFNVDKNLLDNLPNSKFEGVVSPESVAAAYARISRSDLSVDELRKESLLNISEARRANTRIVYDYGHKCYDEETDVLTIDGWKNWKDVKSSDFFATLNCNYEIEYHQPIRLYSSFYSGKMYNVLAKRIDLMVTPNHNMFVCPTTTRKGRKKEDYTLVKASDLGEKPYACKCDGLWSGGESFDNDVLRLLGFSIGDGDTELLGNVNVVSFNLVEERKIEYLRNVRSRLGWQYTFPTCNKQSIRIPKEYVDLFNNIYSCDREKQIPDGLIDKCNKESLLCLWEGLFNSDGNAGTKNRTSDVYASTSARLADQVQHLALHIGRSASIAVRERVSDKHKFLFVVNVATKIFRWEINKKEAGGKSKSRWVDFEGNVFCAEVPNNTLYVRRNGKSVWCGNSIAEHAVFNIDIKGISRLAVEYLEHARLASYTEKSFRYCNLQNDYIVPEEIKSIGLGSEFEELIERQYELYNKLSDRIYKYYIDKEDGAYLEWTKNEVRNKSKKQGKWLRSLAKDQARYCSSLSSTTQLGMTINVRNLEYMIRRLRSSNIIELYDLADKLFEECQPHVPSLLRYQDSIDYIKSGYENVLTSVDCCEFRSCGRRYFQDPEISFYSCSSPFIGFYPPDLLTYRNLINPTVFNIMSSDMKIDKQTKFKIYESILKYVTVHDSLPREFEFVDFTFEVLVSASCYAQLKRHRMSSQVRSCYIETFNYIPSVFIKVDLGYDFEDLMEKVRLLYCKVLEKFDFSIASYVLTQSNMRKVLIKMNARDLYHFFSLRCDKHAGHEIRTLATKMLETCKEKEPMLFMLACGKDDFEKTKKELFKE